MPAPSVTRQRLRQPTRSELHDSVSYSKYDGVHCPLVVTVLQFCLSLNGRVSFQKCERGTGASSRAVGHRTGISIARALLMSFYSDNLEEKFQKSPTEFRVEQRVDEGV